MYKLIALFAIFACASAAPGFLASSLHAPVVAAPVAVAHTVPVATSYANTYKVSVKSPLVAASPIVAAAPAIAYTSPVVKTAPLVAAHATPFIAHAPLAYASHGPLTYASHAPIVAAYH